MFVCKLRAAAIIMACIAFSVFENEIWCAEYETNGISLREMCNFHLRHAGEMFDV